METDGIECVLPRKDNGEEAITGGGEANYFSEDNFTNGLIATVNAPPS